jgi:hypothetical protein
MPYQYGILHVYSRYCTWITYQYIASLQVRKAQYTGMTFEDLHVEQVMYVYVTQHRST